MAGYLKKDILRFVCSMNLPDLSGAIEKNKDRKHTYGDIAQLVVANGC